MGLPKSGPSLLEEEEEVVVVVVDKCEADPLATATLGAIISANGTEDEDEEDEDEEEEEEECEEPGGDTA